MCDKSTIFQANIKSSLILCETLIKNSSIHEPTKQRPTKQTHSNGYIIITIFNFSPEKKIHRLTLAHTTSEGSQYRTEDCNGLASSTIYFGYRSIPVYRFRFTAIFYYFIQYTKLYF